MNDKHTYIQPGNETEKILEKEYGVLLTRKDDLVFGVKTKLGSYTFQLPRPFKILELNNFFSNEDKLKYCFENCLFPVSDAKQIREEDFVGAQDDLIVFSVLFNYLLGLAGSKKKFF